MTHKHFKQLYGFIRGSLTGSNRIQRAKYPEIYHAAELAWAARDLLLARDQIYYIAENNKATNRYSPRGMKKRAQQEQNKPKTDLRKLKVGLIRNFDRRLLDQQKEMLGKHFRENQEEIDPPLPAAEYDEDEIEEGDY